MGLFVENGIVGTEERDGLKACPASLVYLDTQDPQSCVSAASSISHFRNYFITGSTKTQTLSPAGEFSPERHSLSLSAHCCFMLLSLFIIIIIIGVQLLYSVVFISAVQQSKSAICIHVYICIYPLPLGSPSRPSRSSQRAELSALYMRFLLTIYSKHSAYMSIPISQLFRLPPPHTVSTRPFSMSASLFLPCK